MDNTVLFTIVLAVSLIIPAVAAVFMLAANAWAISMYRRDRPFVGYLCLVIAIAILGVRFVGLTTFGEQTFASVNIFGYGDLILVAVCAWWATYTMVRYHGAQKMAPVNIRHRKVEA